MDVTKAAKILSICLLQLIIAPNSYAQTVHSQATIEGSSVDWQDAEARGKQFCKIPQWNNANLQMMFEAYKNPARYHLPSWLNGQRVNYNAMFIQAFWGSKDNPFVKMPRPAKVFVFPSVSNHVATYYMAPVVQSDSDHQYYVFDTAESSPIELQQWIKKKTNTQKLNVKFNICNGYGSTPDAVCDATSYENEIYQYPTVSMNHMPGSRDFPLASREANQDWHDAARQHQVHHNVPGSIMRTAVPWLDKQKRSELVKLAPFWESAKRIKRNFNLMRDTRYFQDEYVANFGRRISWLYPDDGCWTRIAAMIKDYFGPRENPVATFARPAKVYAFGNLCVNTNNTMTGKMNWWYHTAPIVRDAKSRQAYVIDPSVNAAAPLLLEDWIAAISSNTGACAGTTNAVDTFNVCDSYGINPYDSCDFTPYEDFGKEVDAMLIQKFYRRFEWQRQVALGNKPEEVLGDTPPWLFGKQ